MRKIPCLFDRDWSRDVPAYPRITAGQEWVLNPLSNTLPTEKFDGTCVAVKGREVYKRRTVEVGEEPTGFVLDIELRNVQPLIETGDLHGWVPIDTGDPADQYHVEGIKNTLEKTGLDHMPEGTYELIGPKIQGNPHGVAEHYMFRHGAVPVRLHVDGREGVEYNYRLIKQFLKDNVMEGIVFHEVQGNRVAKVTRRDFGIEWPA